MTKTRIAETASIHKIYADFYRISGGLALVILGIWIGSLIFSDGYATNVYTELLSVVATILVLDQINQWRDRRALKERLFNEVKSPAVGQATAALAWLRRDNWIQSDSFKNADLQNVNWSNAYLGELNFEKTNLRGANLQNVTNENSDDDEDNRWRSTTFNHANLQLTKLQDAKLALASFRQADLYASDLSGAYLRDVDLRFANLRRARLHGTVLTNANLSGANLFLASIENNKWTYLDGTREAILPDGTTWTPDTDMEKFSNPEHPDFDTTLAKINAIRLEAGIDPLS